MDFDPRDYDSRDQERFNDRNHGDRDSSHDYDRGRGLARAVSQPATGSALDIPAEPAAGCQSLLARFARLDRYTARMMRHNEYEILARRRIAVQSSGR